MEPPQLAAGYSASQNKELDDSINHGMRLAGKTMEEIILQEMDDGIQETVPETWENIGREKRQITGSMGTIQYTRRIYKEFFDLSVYMENLDSNSRITL